MVLADTILRKLILRHLHYAHGMLLLVPYKMGQVTLAQNNLRQAIGSTGSFSIFVFTIRLKMLNYLFK